MLCSTSCAIAASSSLACFCFDAARARRTTCPLRAAAAAPCCARLRCCAAAALLPTTTSLCVRPPRCSPSIASRVIALLSPRHLTRGPSCRLRRTRRDAHIAISCPCRCARRAPPPPPHERLVHSSASHSLRTSTPPVIPAAATKWDPGGTWVPGPTSWSHHRAHPCRMHSPPLLRARTVRQAPLGTARALPRPRGASATLCSTLPLLLLFNSTSRAHEVVPVLPRSARSSSRRVRVLNLRLSYLTVNSMLINS